MLCASLCACVRVRVRVRPRAALCRRALKFACRVSACVHLLDLRNGRLPDSSEWLRVGSDFGSSRSRLRPKGRSVQCFVQFEDPVSVSQSDCGRRPSANDWFDAQRCVLVSAGSCPLLVDDSAGLALPARLSGCGAHCRTRKCAGHSLLTPTRCEPGLRPSLRCVLPDVKFAVCRVVYRKEL